MNNHLYCQFFNVGGDWGDGPSWNIINEELPPKIGPRSFSSPGIYPSSAETNPTLSSAEPYLVQTVIFGFGFQSDSIFSYCSEMLQNFCLFIAFFFISQYHHYMYLYVHVCPSRVDLIPPSLPVHLYRDLKWGGHVPSGYQLDPTSQWFIKTKNHHKIKLCSSVTFLSHHPSDKLLHKIKKLSVDFI